MRRRGILRAGFRLSRSAPPQSLGISSRQSFDNDAKIRRPLGYHACAGSFQSRPRRHLRAWAASDPNPPRPTHRGKGIKREHLAAALRLLGYCRLVKVEGRQRADEYMDAINEADPKPKEGEKQRFMVRDHAEARARVRWWFHKLYPWLPDTENPFTPGS